MKKLIFTLLLIGVLSGCVTHGDNIEKLQKLYPNAVVYKCQRSSSYIVADSTHIYEIRMCGSGEIISTIKIK